MRKRGRKTFGLRHEHTIPPATSPSDDLSSPTHQTPRRSSLRYLLGSALILMPNLQYSPLGKLLQHAGYFIVFSPYHFTSMPFHIRPVIAQPGERISCRKPSTIRSIRMQRVKLTNALLPISLSNSQFHVKDSRYSGAAHDLGGLNVVDVGAVCKGGMSRNEHHPNAVLISKFEDLVVNCWQKVLEDLDAT